MKDYYHILEVSKTSSFKEIKLAYRRLALVYHPDINDEASAKDKFVLINEAYQVLSKPALRRKYDWLMDYYAHPTSYKQARYTRRKDRRQTQVYTAAHEGQANAEKYAHESKERFGKRLRRFGGKVFSNVVFDLILEIISVFIRIH